jgi:hypothetical protein
VSKHPPLIVQSTRDLGPQFVDNPHHMVGQDGAFSIPLSASESLWFFGDTLIGRRVPGESLWYPGGVNVGHADMTGRGPIERMINNSGLVAPNRGLAEGLKGFRYLTRADGGLRTLLPLEGGEHPDWDRIWCQHGIYVGSKLYLSFIQVRMLAQNPGPLPIGFEIVGSGLAVGRMYAGGGVPERFRRVTRDGGHILWGANEPHFATAFLDGQDGRVYLYGSVSRGGVQQCYLARAKSDALEDIAGYEYLVSQDPVGWGRDVSWAVPLFDGMPSELSVSYNAHLGCYLAVHSQDLTGAIVGRTAATPWGPFSEPVELFVTKVVHGYPVPYPTLVYAGKEHPQLSPDGGRTIYLTYIEFEEYFPHLVEVTLA